MYNFRTDLADERTDILKKNKNTETINGIDININEKDNIKITEVKITDENGEKAIGKPIGSYITIDIKNINEISENKLETCSEILAEELRKIINKHVEITDEILIVGLGNIYVTPDSLGPKVINEIEVTRHILKYAPEYIDRNTRSVSAISPGVLGTTGIETLEIIKGVIDNIKPKLLIVIDALASRSIERISSSIQISDTGIVPGAGVDNERKELSKKTLGIPVIAIGIPTVVECAVLVNDCIEMMLKNMNENIEDESNYNRIRDTLISNKYNMIVTPKEIDDLIEKMKDVVSNGINKSI